MDKKLFQQFVPIAEGIGKLLSPYAEVIIHDFKTKEILHIVNPFSKRKRGFPSNIEDVQLALDQEIIGPYEKTNWDSKKLKSISIVLKDCEGHPKGLLCINLDISIPDEINKMITGFISQKNMITQPEQLFKNDWHEKVNGYIHSWVNEKQTTIHRLTNQEKNELVKKLYFQGAFKNPKSHEYVAGLLGLGRATIFKYLKQLKENRE